MNVRYYGMTDECTTCEHCGKSGLKNTVVLEILDDDGNAEGATWYGTTCAAKALGRTAASVRKDALAAHTQTREEAEWALRFFNKYNLDPYASDYEIKAAHPKFMNNNPQNPGFDKFLQCIRVHRSSIEKAEMIGC